MPHYLAKNMILNLDLHSHSGYAGGVGQISLEKLAETMPLKGIHIFGTGDCLHGQWQDDLKEQLVDRDGIFVLKTNENAQFILQTELIFTAPIGKGRKSVHTVFLFPSFDAISGVEKLLDKWGVKNTIGRPFIKCKNPDDVGKKLLDIHNIDNRIEIIPAHVMTPQGVFGSNNPINSLKDFYADATQIISCVETGLSADPVILGMIPELDNLTLVSNSDAHSAALHRIGREFTSVEVTKNTYDSIIDSLRRNHVARTSEFNPTEGRFFLTGHRKGKKGHEKGYCVFSPQHTPKDSMCPVCNKKLTVGVLERAFELSDVQTGGDPRELGYLPKNSKDFVHMVPLIEMIAYSFGIKAVESNKVIKLYKEIVAQVGSECELWFTDKNKLISQLERIAPTKLIDNILTVRQGNFCFRPAGFDGAYGNLVIGEQDDFLTVNEIIK